jgi:hypothetical protein
MKLANSFEDMRDTAIFFLSKGYAVHIKAGE